MKPLIYRIFIALRAKWQVKSIKKFGVRSHWYGGEIHCSRELSIGDYVYIGPGFIAHAFGGIEIGDGTIIGPRLTVHTRNHRFEHSRSIPYDNEYVLKDVKIGRGVWIGDSVMLLPGARIGDGAVVGAGSIVSGIVPDYSIVAGNPAKIIRLREDIDAAKQLLQAGAYYMKSKSG